MVPVEQKNYIYIYTIQVHFLRLSLRNIGVNSDNIYTKILVRHAKFEFNFSILFLKIFLLSPVSYAHHELIIRIFSHIHDKKKDIQKNS